ncbi:ATP-binding protein [Caproicibacter sp.]|uniref:tRNA lysidine(34) synthetase n=1 Tax=Caproicibacter sp. TaxID=2814884 RepID=UPI003989316F
MNKSEEIETSIFKRYRRRIWIPFLTAVKEYRLIQPGDRVAVCISGGKDSMLTAKCMQHLQKYSEFPFEAEYLVMDPGYNEENRRRIEENAALLNLPIKIFETKIYDIVSRMEGSPCYICARMRRGHLYKHAQELGCNKIALGHHFDDVIETTLMSMLYGAEIKTMMPKLHSKNYPGMELIRPMYLVHEADIISWRDSNQLGFIRCACRFTENCELNGGSSKRKETKELVERLRKINPGIDQNIFHSVHNVNLDTVLGYRSGGKTHSFLDDYDRKENKNDEEGNPVR